MASSYLTITDEKPALEHGTTFEVLGAFEDLVEQLSPAGAVPEPAELAQARRNAELRHALLAEHGALDAEDVANCTGSQARNRHQTVYRLAKAGRIFGVRWHGKRLYPAFQFDVEEGVVLPQIAQVLQELPDRMEGWELALWFVNEVADRETGQYVRPVDVLDDTARLRRLAAETRRVWHEAGAA